MSKNYFETFGGGAFASGHKSISGAEIGVSLKISFDKDLSKLFEKAKLKSVYAVAKAIDEVGNKTKTQVIRAVAKQAGVKEANATLVAGTEKVDAA